MFDSLVHDYLTFLRVDGWIGAMVVCWLGASTQVQFPRRAILMLGLFCAGQAVFGSSGFFHYDVLSFGGNVRPWLTIGKFANFVFLWEFARTLRVSRGAGVASPWTHLALLVTLGFALAGVLIPSLGQAMQLGRAGLNLLIALIGVDAVWQLMRWAQAHAVLPFLKRAGGWAAAGVVAGLVLVGTMRPSLRGILTGLFTVLPWILAGVAAWGSIRGQDTRSRWVIGFAAALIIAVVATPFALPHTLENGGADARSQLLSQARATLLGGGLAVVICQAGFLLTWRLALDEAHLVATATREAASRAKTEFLAYLGHELRTPLQAILGQAELLQNEKDAATRALAVQTISAEGKVMLRLVNDLLDLGTIEAGHFEFRPRPVSLRRLLASATATFENAARAKGLAVVVTIGTDVPESIAADEARLLQVLRNLLGNAVKFTSVGGVELRVALVASKPEDGNESARLRFLVRDSGIGLPPDEIARLFTPFTRLGRGDTVNREGTGLGLAVVKRFVEAMGGTVSAANRADGAGAEFAVELVFPIARAVDEASFGGEAAQLTPVTPLAQRVLVVEDHPAVRALLVAFLRTIGHVPVAAIDGKTARTALAQGSFDAVVLDISLPDTDGETLAREVAEMRGSALRPRLIGCSAEALPDRRTSALKAGMDAFLTKPVSLKDLESALTDGLDLFSILRARQADPAVSQSIREELPSVRAALRTAVELSDWPEVRRLAHYLHNSALMLGDEVLSAAAQAIARIEKRPDSSEARAQLAQLMTDAGLAE